MPQQHCENTKQDGGFIALISVLVLASVGVVVGVSLLLLDTSYTRTSFVTIQSHQAKALANACAEQALLKLSVDISYAGNETITLGQGSCTILSVVSAGPNRTIKTSGTVGTIIRRVEIKAKVSPSFQVTTWEEVADF